MNSLRSASFDLVMDVLKEAADTAVMPRFRKLRESDVVEKAKDELVTIADREAEQLIAPRLIGLLPGSRVVGEEACSADASLLDRLDEGTVWLVDPLDGTANFVAGRPLFATMAALLVDGVAVGAWIFNPVTRAPFMAELGAGAWCDGHRLHVQAVERATTELRGAVLTRFLPPELKSRVESRRHNIRDSLPGLRCAGVEYPAIIKDEQQFAMFWRTLPWDHVPGTLLLSEAGGHVARFDGARYRAHDTAKGLLGAANEEVWRQVHDALIAEGG
jgi:fructose-1,6-bisphosphatase/inositol monophosphatase family enzyme